MSTGDILGIPVPDSAIAREATELVRDSESELLFLHSMRVYAWGALAGRRRKLAFDPELLYVGSMFHDLGLAVRFRESTLRFEVDGANAARDFLRGHGIAERDIEKVWSAIAFHTTPGIPQFMHPEAALLHVATGMDVAGRAYDQFTDEEREAVTSAWPRAQDFKHAIIDAFYEGLKHRPDSTFGTFNDDFIAFRNPAFRRVDLCSIILHSPWAH
ncbi:HD domain-containing protein [Frateuria sp. YIM B11624]|uniref:HD domain-containing protein n=1 Tax=Frateuria sp. YIM B11624 TaxID=3143185 RepID=UPI003C77B57E